jgi:hypothetical protein
VRAASDDEAGGFNSDYIDVGECCVVVSQCCIELCCVAWMADRHICSTSYRKDGLEIPTGWQACLGLQLQLRRRNCPEAAGGAGWGVRYYNYNGNYL